MKVLTVVCIHPPLGGSMTLVYLHQTCRSVVAIMTVLQVVRGQGHNHMSDPRRVNGVELCGRAAAQYSSHSSIALRAVQPSPVWLVDHSSVELHPIIIKRCQSWSHILLPVSLITPPLLGSKQLLPAARTLHRSLGTDNERINNKNKRKSEITHISPKKKKRKKKVTRKNYFDIIILRKLKVCWGEKWLIYWVQGTINCFIIWKRTIT